MWDTAVSRRFPSVGQPTCRFDELVLEVFVDSLKGHSENYTTFDTLPAVSAESSTNAPGPAVLGPGLVFDEPSSKHSCGCFTRSCGRHQAPLGVQIKQT